MLKTPIIIVNFKSYKEATGKKAMILAKACDHVAENTNANIAIAPQLLDIERIYEIVDIPILAQHVDPVELGAKTGYALPEAVKAAGAIGSIINHSEHTIRFTDVEKTIERCEESGLRSIVCAPNSADAQLIDALKPDMIAVEPPELISGKVSISKAKPQLIIDAVQHLRSKVLVGAGIHTTKDVKTAIALGADGVLVASGIVKARNPRLELMKLVDGLR